jgi:enoyl-CoA hydratase/carnithine racemase
MGHALDAAAAKDAGLVNAVVPAAELEETALTAARKIAALPPLAVKAARALMRPSPEEIVARIDQEAEIFRTHLSSAEAKAAFAAFLNRKK